MSDGFIRVAKSFDKSLGTPTMPTRGSAKAAGWDLYASKDTVIPAQGKGLIQTGIHIIIPDGYYGRIAPRSGMSWKFHTDIGAGVIDSDYRGTLGVVLFNHSNKDLTIKTKDRVAQLIIEKINTAQLLEVHYDLLDNTLRGDGAFGSTGV